MNLGYSPLHIYSPRACDDQIPLLWDSDHQVWLQMLIKRRGSAHCLQAFSTPPSAPTQGH